MAGTIRYRNLVIQSIDSRILAIWCHGWYYPHSRQTTVPATAQVIWHAPRDLHGVLTKGARYIRGHRTAAVLEDFERTPGGHACLDYTLGTKLDDPTTLPAPVTVDYLTVVPGRVEVLSTVWEAMRNKHLDYEWVHFFGCRVLAQL